MVKNNIGFFCTKIPSVPPFTNTDGHDVGGAGESLIDLVCNLSNKKYKKYIFTIGTANQIQKESPKPNMELIRYPPSLKIFKKIFSTGENLFSTKFITLPRKKELDIIHCQLGQPLADVSSLFYKKFSSDIPIVLSIRGVPRVEWGGVLRRSSMKLYIKTVYEPILKKSDKIVIQSQGVLEEDSRVQEFKSKVNIVPNGVDFKTFSKFCNINNHNSKYTRKEQDCDKVLLFVGSLVERKGIPTLISSYEKVLHKYPSTKLIIVGKGPMENYIIDRSKKGDYSDKLNFEGFVSNPEKLAKIYSSADFFILPSLAEGFPRVILESMAAGTPCLVSDIGANFHAVGKGRYGLVAEVKNADDFAKKIMDYFEMDEKKKMQLRKDGFEYAKNHSWENVAREMEEIYEKLL